MQSVSSFLCRCGSDIWRQLEPSWSPSKSTCLSVIRCEEKCEVFLLLSFNIQYLHLIMQYMHLSKSCWCGMEDLMESFIFPQEFLSGFKAHWVPSTLHETFSFPYLFIYIKNLYHIYLYTHTHITVQIQR